MKSRFNVLILFLVLLASLAAATGRAANFTNNPTADAFVTTGPAGAQGATNYGSAGALGISAPGEPKGEFQSVMKFDLSAAKASFDTQFGAGLWTVQSLTLRLTATPTNNALFNANTAGLFKISLMQNNTWTEGTGTPGTPTTDGITFNSLTGTYINNAADKDLGTFSYNGASSGAVSYSLTLDPDALADVMAGGILSLRGYAGDSSVSYLFNSENFGSSGNRPQFIITAVPEPSVAALFAAGVALLAAAKRFRGSKSLR